MAEFAQQLTTLLPQLIRSGGVGGLTTAAEERQLLAVFIQAVAALELRARGSRIFTGELNGGPPDPSLGVEYDLFISTDALDLFRYSDGEWLFMVNLMPRGGGPTGPIPSQVQDSLTGNSTTLAPSVRAVNERFSRLAMAVISGTNQIFPTYEAAEAVLNDGDTVYLYGYHAGITVDKGLNVKGTANLGSVTVGYLGGNSFSATFAPTLTLEGRNVVCAPTVLGKVYTVLFNGCQTGPHAFFEQYSYFAPDGTAPAALVTVRNVDLFNTDAYVPMFNGATGGGCLRFQEHGYDAHARWTFENSRLASQYNSIFTGYPQAGSRAELKGTTVVVPAAGRPLTDLLLLNGPAQPESTFLIDSRSQSSGNYASLDPNGHVFRSQLPPLNWQATYVKIVDEGLATERTENDPVAVAAAFAAWLQSLPGYVNNNTVSLRGNLTWAAAGTTPPTNTGPVASNVRIRKGGIDLSTAPAVGDVLEGAYTYGDAENDAQGTTTFQWFTSTDGTAATRTAIAGATQQTFTVTSAQLGKGMWFAPLPVAASGTANGVQTFSSVTQAVVPAAGGGSGSSTALAQDASNMAPAGSLVRTGSSLALASGQSNANATWSTLRGAAGTEFVVQSEVTFNTKSGLLTLDVDGANTPIANTVKYGIYAAPNGLRTYLNGNSSYENLASGTATHMRLRVAANVLYYEYSTNGGTVWTEIRNTPVTVDVWLKVLLTANDYPALNNVRYTNLVA